MVPNESTAQIKRHLCRGIPLNMPRVTTDVPPQAAALQGIGHQKSTSRNHTRQGDLPKKHGDAFIAVVEGFTMEPPGARLAVSPPPFKVNFRNSRFRLFIVNGNTDRGTWEDWNSLSSVIHVFAESWIWHSYLQCCRLHNGPSNTLQVSKVQTKGTGPFLRLLLLSVGSAASFPRNFCQSYNQRINSKRTGCRRGSLRKEKFE